MARSIARTDANQAAIVAGLAKAGISVQSLATIGNGCPDLLCGVGGRNVLLEVKDPSQPPSARRFTSHQKRWHAAWKGRAHCIETLQQALDVCAAYKQGRV